MTEPTDVLFQPDHIDPELREARDLTKRVGLKADAHLLANELPFHNKNHTDMVRQRTHLILEALRRGGVTITDHDKMAGYLAASGHDLIQEWSEDTSKPGKVLRKRARVDNEHASADLMLQWISEEEAALGKTVFSEADKQHIREATDVTIPSYDPAQQTVFQEGLTPDVHPITRAVALADIGAAGMDPDAYIAGGDELFREENLDVHGLDVATLDDEQKTALRARILFTCRDQIVFAKGRQALLERELEGLPDAAKEQVRALFSKFDESVQRATQVAEAREAMSFEELYRDMGLAV